MGSLGAGLGFSRSESGPPPAPLHPTGHAVTLLPYVRSELEDAAWGSGGVQDPGGAVSPLGVPLGGSLVPPQDRRRCDAVPGLLASPATLFMAS